MEFAIPPCTFPFFLFRDSLDDRRRAIKINRPYRVEFVARNSIALNDLQTATRAVACIMQLLFLVRDACIFLIADLEEGNKK